MTGRPIRSSTPCNGDQLSLSSLSQSIIPVEPIKQDNNERNLSGQLSADQQDDLRQSRTLAEMHGQAIELTSHGEKCEQDQELDDLSQDTKARIAEIVKLLPRIEKGGDNRVYFIEKFKFNLFWVRFEISTDEMALAVTTIQQLIKENQPLVLDDQAILKIQTGDQVIARFSGDWCMYRGRVEKIFIEQGLLLIRFIDFGNKEYVEFRDIHEPLPFLDQIPPQAFLCSLDPRPKTSKIKRIENFKKLAITVKDVSYTNKFSAIHAVVEARLCIDGDKPKHRTSSSDRDSEPPRVDSSSNPDEVGWKEAKSWEFVSKWLKTIPSNPDNPVTDIVLEEMRLQPRKEMADTGNPEEFNDSIDHDFELPVYITDCVPEDCSVSLLITRVEGDGSIYAFDAEKLEDVDLVAEHLRDAKSLLAAEPGEVVLGSCWMWINKEELRCRVRVIEIFSENFLIVNIDERTEHLIKKEGELFWLPCGPLRNTPALIMKIHLLGATLPDNLPITLFEDMLRFKEIKGAVEEVVDDSLGMTLRDKELGDMNRLLLDLAGGSPTSSNNNLASDDRIQEYFEEDDASLGEDCDINEWDPLNSEYRDTGNSYTSTDNDANYALFGFRESAQSCKFLLYKTCHRGAFCPMSHELPPHGGVSAEMRPAPKMNALQSFTDIMGSVKMRSVSSPTNFFIVAESVVTQTGSINHEDIRSALMSRATTSLGRTSTNLVLELGRVVGYEDRKRGFSRGLITEYSSSKDEGEGLVELFLIDHGETVVAHIHDLRELPPAVVALPRLSISCALVGARPANQAVWSTRACEWLKAVASKDEALFCKMWYSATCENSLVELDSPSEGDLVNKLVQLGFADPSPYNA